MICIFQIGCSDKQIDKFASDEPAEPIALIEKPADNDVQILTFYSVNNRQRIKLGHSINTVANEYLPVCNSEGNKLYFSAMDRTGFFDFKLDFTKNKSSGGEDIFVSNLTEGIWEDARPLNALNTSGHEVVTQVLINGDLMITGNYSENFGVGKDRDAWVQTTDLFFIRNLKSGYQINHLPEPVNSIFTEADGYMAEDESFILFVSDRSGNVGEYHKKGWKWNESFWGNTDIYVSIKEGDYWSVPINLGTKVNTPFAERTPWLSADRLTLFLSSNGYTGGKTDLDVYAFKRNFSDDWTNWDGPYMVEDANTAYDDWGYKETCEGSAYVASASKLGFKPTQPGIAGDGGAMEINYRPGYEIHGLQVASLNKAFETNIYFLQNPIKPSFIASDLYFDLDSYFIKKPFEKYLMLLVDQINENKNANIEINGHTDNQGNEDYNMKLSKRRAEAVKSYLISKGVSNSIVVQGFGDQMPAFPNSSAANRLKNRRVEVFIKRSNYE